MIIIKIGRFSSPYKNSYGLAKRVLMTKKSQSYGHLKRMQKITVPPIVNDNLTPSCVFNPDYYNQLEVFYA